MPIRPANRAGLHVLPRGDGDSAHGEHPTRDRAALPAGGAQPQERGSATACRCATWTVAGTCWAYDRQAGWHDPDEHADWRPPYWPTC